MRLRLGAVLDKELIFEELKNFPEIQIENLALNFDFSKIEMDLGPEEDNEKEDLNKKYLLEVQLHNELDLRDLYDDLISKGFMVREKKS